MRGHHWLMIAGAAYLAIGVYQSGVLNGKPFNVSNIILWPMGQH